MPLVSSMTLHRSRPAAALFDTPRRGWSHAKSLRMNTFAKSPGGHPPGSHPAGVAGATARQNEQNDSHLRGKIGSMPVRLIALDIDGTLLDSRWQLPEANRAAITEATRRGIEVALVTGRRYDFAMPIARQLDCPITMIVNNGALIRSAEGETKLRHLLPRDIAADILRRTAAWRDGAAVIFDRPLENQLMLESLDPDDSLRYAYYSRNKQFIGFAKPLESCLTEDPIQVMFSGHVAPMREAEAVLRNGLRANGDSADRYALAV